MNCQPFLRDVISTNLILQRQGRDFDGVKCHKWQSKVLKRHSVFSLAFDHYTLCSLAEWRKAHSICCQ